MCPDGVHQAEYWRSLSGETNPPCSLILKAGRGSDIDGFKSPSASLAVVSQGKPYKLVAVVYDHSGQGHFSCQARFLGRWIYYDDLSYTTKPTSYERFNAAPENDSVGKPYIYVYARDYFTERAKTA